MSLIKFSGKSLQHFIQVLESEIEYTINEIQDTRKNFELKRENERAQRRELAQKQKKQLFHILTFGIFVESEEEYFGSPCEGGFDEEQWIQDFYEEEEWKDVNKLGSLLNTAKAAEQHQTELYVSVEDIELADYSYWTEDFKAKEKI